MAQYEFRFSIEAGGLWTTEADDVHEARRKFIETPTSELRLGDSEIPIHEIIVYDEAGEIIKVFDEAECEELTPEHWRKRTSPPSA